MTCANGAVTLEATSAVTVSAALAGSGADDAVKSRATTAVAAATGLSASLARLRARIGLMTKKASSAAKMLSAAASWKIGSQLPVASFRMFAYGTSKAAV